MRAQLIIVFLVTFASFIGVLVWRVDEIMFSDKLSWSEAQSRSQMSPLVHSLEIEFSNLSDTLSLSAATIQDTKKDYSRGSSLGRYQMVSTLKNLGSKEWSLDKTVFLDKASSKAWAAQYISLLLKNIDANDIKPGGFAALSVLDPQRKAHLFLLHNMITSVEGGEVKRTNWYGVLVGPEFFQSLMDRQKGQMSSVFLVNQLGQALGHTTPEYVGNVLSEDPIVSELMRAQTGNGSGTFKNLKGDAVHGFYEQVAKSNVYAVITTPVSSLLKNRDQVRLQIIMMGLGLAFVGIAAFVLIYRPEKQIARMIMSQPPQGLQKVVAPAMASAGAVSTIAANSAVSSAVATNKEVVKDAVKDTVKESLPAASTQAEKMQIFLRMASALSHEIKGPLSAILGHVQLLKSSPGSVEHLVGIEEQARKSRELIQKLMIFTGEDSPKFRKVKLSDLVRKALRNVEAQTFRKGILVNVADLKEVPEIDLPADLVCRAIENILTNAIEAMERGLKKELKISLGEKSGSFELRVSDTGEGIESQNLAHIFEPFFTTKSSQHQAGLGLSMSLGILKEINASMSVESERGKGTAVIMNFNPITATKTGDVTDHATGHAPSPVAATHVVPSSPKPAPGPAVLAVPGPSAAIAKTSGMMILDDKEVEDVLGMNEMDEMDEVTVPNAVPMAAQVAPSASALAVTSTAISLQEPVLESFATSLDSPPPPAKSGTTKPDLKPDLGASKIDKPQIVMPTRSSKLDAVQFQIRRPGDRNADRSTDKNAVDKSGDKT